MDGAMFADKRKLMASYIDAIKVFVLKFWIKMRKWWKINRVEIIWTKDVLGLNYLKSRTWVYDCKSILAIWMILIWKISTSRHLNWNSCINNWHRFEMHHIQCYWKSQVWILLPNQALPPKFNINGFNFYDDNSFMHALVGTWAYEDLILCHLYGDICIFV